ncbi:MAG: hypothetical protein RSA17_08415, partial [Ruthenibacterium sp.]
MNIDKIAENLTAALTALSELKKEGAPQDSNENYRELEVLARNHPFQNHILCNAGEQVQNLYITALLAILSDENEDAVRNQQLLVLGRIIASYNKQIDFAHYTTRCVKISAGFWSDFTDFMVDDLKFCFAVDALLVFHLSHSASETTLNAIADVMQFLGLTAEEIQKAAAIARTIMAQDFFALLDLVECADGVNYTPFLGYFPGQDWNFIVTSLSSAKGLAGKIIIAGACEENTSKPIHLDECAGSRLFFYRCTFKRTCGMVSATVPSEFVRCTFQDNLIPEAAPGQGSGKTVSDFTFLELTNSRIASSQFIHCRATKHLICLTNGTISDCDFVNCRGVDLPCSYLLEINLSVVTGCSFTNCRMDTDSPDRNSTTGGLVALNQSEMLNSTFHECTAYGDSSFGSYARFSMYIIMANESNVAECQFEKCYCQSKDANRKTSSSYILGLSKATEHDNAFKECQSYHYSYGSICGTHDVG